MVAKRENEKKRLAKREEKQKKKEKKRPSGTANDLDSMIAYVNENGVITSTPPIARPQKEEINLEDIAISTPKREEEVPTILVGRVEYFNDAKGFGFIKELSKVDKYFFHVNNVNEEIAENDMVTFELVRDVKGMSAINVSLEKK